ncbi:hypothetical protein ACCI51_08305 [Microbulbifer echini]|uniref:Uncharacterized protein n=1 Tax=Microbulbifer echini TaxID=1529067 RepID=A0ABV4NND2_9GAMM|nr:hypothetical protein [uncultured Microbulbifer sp.]
MDIVNQILSWPAIVQGAIGSGLFWLVLHLGQKITKISQSLLGRHRHEVDMRDRIIIAALESQDIKQISTVLSMGSFFGIHYIFKALIFVVLGLCIQNIIPTFGTIGYVGGLVYLFLGLRACPALESYSNKISKKEEPKVEAQEC